MSPSSRGRGLKSLRAYYAQHAQIVALFTRAWIEIYRLLYCGIISTVALFTRAWIEIIINGGGIVPPPVALFTRAWIEIETYGLWQLAINSRPLHEGVD